MNIIVIGDSHAKPGVSNERFTWLGRMIADIKPDVVVEMGDFADMPSLSSYDGSKLTGGGPSKKSFEGRRYKNDVAAAIDARERVTNEIKRTKRKMPRLVALGGNHCEGRIHRAVENVPELDGVISVEDLQVEALGWEYTPFLRPFSAGGFVFQHYFESGVKGQPVGGEYPATTMLKKQFASTVSGHSHLFDESHRKTATGGKIQAFIAGCYLAESQREEYAGGANTMWDKGILFMRDVNNGFCEGGFSWVTAKVIRETYK